MIVKARLQLVNLLLSKIFKLSMINMTSGTEQHKRRWADGLEILKIRTNMGFHSTTMKSGLWSRAIPSSVNSTKLLELEDFMYSLYFLCCLHFPCSVG